MKRPRIRTRQQADLLFQAELGNQGRLSGPGSPAGWRPTGLNPPITVTGVLFQAQDTGLSCIRMYGICGSLGEGFM